jgi:uncharacterized protein
MAQHENADRIRRGFEAFNNGDLAALSDLIAEDAVQEMGGKNVFTGEHKGRDSIFQMYGGLAERTGGTFRAELQQVFANDTTGVAIYRGTGERDGKTLDQPSALVFEFVDGVAVRLTDVASDAEAQDDFLA